MNSKYTRTLAGIGAIAALAFPAVSAAKGPHGHGHSGSDDHVHEWKLIPAVGGPQTVVQVHGRGDDEKIVRTVKTDARGDKRCKQQRYAIQNPNDGKAKELAGERAKDVHGKRDWRLEIGD